MNNTVWSLTQLQKSIIQGSALGDGYIRQMPGRKDAFLEINHSIKAKEYVDWKFSNLKNLCLSSPKERIIDERRIAYRFFTCQHSEITEIYEKFYENKKKRFPKNFELDPISLAVWFMDDGSRTKKGDFYLNSQQFSMNDQKKMLHALRVIGIRARLNKDKKYHRIRIYKESIPKLIDIIKPWIVPSMKYKIVEL